MVVFGIDLPPYLFWLIMLFIMVGMGIVLQRIKAASDAEDQRELQKFLTRWHGKLETRADGSRQIRLVVAGTPVAIEYTERTEGDDVKRFTHLNIPCDARLPRLEVLHQHAIPPLAFLFSYPGNEDILIGVPDFDDAFLIHGKDPQRIREFLTADVRAAIFTVSRFDSFGKHDEFHLETYDGGLRISKHYLVRTDVDLSQFVSYGKALADVIQQQRTGIEFVGAGPPVLVKNTQCRVCGDPLSNQVVFCAKCRSPQHHDCWQYIGGCSVYGCGHKQFVANQRPAPQKK